MQANSLMALEITRRNARRLLIIQESIQKINTILDDLTQEPQPTDTPDEEQMLYLEDNPNKIVNIIKKIMKRTLHLSTQLMQPLQ